MRYARASPLVSSATKEREGDLDSDLAQPSDQSGGAALSVVRRSRCSSSAAARRKMLDAHMRILANYEIYTSTIKICVHTAQQIGCRG